MLIASCSNYSSEPQQHRTGLQAGLTWEGRPTSTHNSVFVCMRVRERQIIAFDHRAVFNWIGKALKPCFDRVSLFLLLYNSIGSSRWGLFNTRCCFCVVTCYVCLSMILTLVASKLSSILVSLTTFQHMWLHCIITHQPDWWCLPSNISEKHSGSCYCLLGWVFPTAILHTYSLHSDIASKLYHDT